MCLEFTAQFLLRETRSPLCEPEVHVAVSRKEKMKRKKTEIDFLCRLPVRQRPQCGWKWAQLYSGRVERERFPSCCFAANLTKPASVAQCDADTPLPSMLNDPLLPIFFFQGSTAPFWCKVKPSHFCCASACCRDMSFFLFLFFIFPNLGAGSG